MAHYPNQNGDGGIGQAYGNGEYEYGYSNGEYGYGHGDGGYEQQLGDGVYGRHHGNNLDRQQYGNLGNAEQNQGYGIQTHQPHPNGTNGTNRPYRIAPNFMQQHPGGQGFQTQVPAPNGTNYTNIPHRVAPNPNASPFVPKSEAPNAQPRSIVLQPKQGPPITVKFWHGDENIANGSGFLKALDEPALLSVKAKREDNGSLSDVIKHILNNITYSEKCNREADAECMTHSDIARLWENEAREFLKQQNKQRRQTASQHVAQQHPAHQQAPHPSQQPFEVPLELQKAVGKVRTGKSVYSIKAVIEHGGDFMRMSNGIYVVEHPSHDLRVAKFLRPMSDAQFERARAERNVLLKLKELSSPHINFLYEAYWPNGDENCILILELCDGGSIEKRIRIQQQKGVKFTEEFMWHFISHMCSALAACHNGVRNPLKKELQTKTWNCIVHLDIKPANVFISMKRGKGMEDDEFPTIVLGDFGCAVTANDILQGVFQKRVQPFGTEGWYPPEAKATTGKHAGRYGKSTDIWQLGALIVCMCRLTIMPDPYHLYSAQPCGPGYGTELQTLAKWCLDVDLEKRPSAVDIAEKMKVWRKIVVECENSGENSGRA